jgi:gliding motility-associated-like protein
MTKLWTVGITICYLLFCSYVAKAQGPQTFTDGQVTPQIVLPSAGCVYHWNNNNPAIGLAASGTGNIPSFTAINNGTTPITATITATPSPTGFAYIANSQDGTVSVINTSTNQVTALVQVGKSPFGVAISSDSKVVYIANIVSGTVSAINTASNTVTAFNGGSLPYALCLSPDNQTIYVADNGSNSIAVGNTATGQIINNIRVAASPYALVMSPDGSRFYVAHNTMASSYVTVISTAAGNPILATIQVPVAPEGLAVSPDGSMLYATAVGANLVTFINTQTNKVVNTYAVGHSPEGITISPDGTKLYITNYQDNSVSVINTANGQTITTVPVGSGPTGISADPDGSSVYVTNSGDKTVSVIRTSDNSISAVVGVGGTPNSQGNFVSSATVCDPVSFTITIEPNPKNLPTIISNNISGNLSACAGDLPSNTAVGQFSVSGTKLNAPVQITATTGFEISSSPGSGFGPTLELPVTSGNLATVPVYIRLTAGDAIGPVNGIVVLTSPGAQTISVPVSGLVTVNPTMPKVADQAYFNGDPVPAFSFTGNANTFTWINDTPSIGLPASGTGELPAFTAVNNGTTAIIATITVSPSQTGYAYVPNSASNNVTVINTSTNTFVTNIPVGKFPNAAAVSPDGSQVYVVNTAPGQQGSVSVIDAATNKVTGTFMVGMQPWGIAVSPDGNEIYVSNENSNNVSVINTVTKNLITNVGVQTGPVGVTVSPDGKYVYVANSGSKSISVISTSINQVIATINVGVGPYIAQVSPDGQRLYVPNGTDNTLSIIDANSLKTITTITTPAFPINVAVNPDGSLAYITTNSADEVAIMNTTLNAISGGFGGSTNPVGICLTPDGREIFVVGGGSGKVAIYDAVTDQLLAYVSAGSDPLGYGNFISAGSACSGSPQKFTITVYPRTPPMIAATGNPTALTTTYGTPSATTTVQVSGSGIKSGITVNAPTGFEISTDNQNFNSSLIVGTLGTIGPVTIYIRLAATTPVGPYTNNLLTVNSPGATEVILAIPTSQVYPAPLTVSAVNAGKPYGTSLNSGSGSTAFTASGLQNGETIGSVTIAYGPGADAGAPVGSYPANITVSEATGGSFSATNYSITYLPATLEVTFAPLTIIADNKARAYNAPNPPFTVTYKGFVNGDGPAQLSSLPVVTTIATENSVPGRYPLVPSGAASTNYSFIYVTGLLTIGSGNVPLLIPNTFSPNGDGINDSWLIGNIEAYPNCKVSVFNRYGSLIFSSVGYTGAWDGKFNTADVPTGTYYYIIDLRNQTPPLSGSLTVIR